MITMMEEDEQDADSEKTIKRKNTELKTRNLMKNLYSARKNAII